jgi:DNA/RNA non-specific endonuclease
MGPDEAPDGALLCPEVFGEELRQRWYVIGGQEYWLDEEGRPARARAWLPPVVADDERDAGCQRQVGQWGDATGRGDYDGGHLIGYQLGGWGARANLVPQEANFNRGNWAQVESALASCDELYERQLELLVEVEYASDDGLVPAAMVMTMTDTATGQSIALPFANERGGGSDGEALRREGVAWLRALGCVPD